MNNKRGNHEGTISQLPSKSWRGQIRINGVRESYTNRNKKAVETWLHQKLAQIDQGYNPVKAQQSLDEYWVEFMRNTRLRVKPSTAKDYEDTYRRYIQPPLGRRGLKEFNLRQMEGFYADLYANGYSAHVIHHIHRILHKSFQDAIKYEYIHKNPVHMATKPRIPHKDIHIMDTSQVSRFLLTAREHPLEAMFYLALVTGMRQGELMGLKWDDIHWERGELHIQHQLLHNQEQGAYLAEPKTRAGIRTIPIGENTLQTLRQHKFRQEQQRCWAGERWQEWGLVFTSTIGTPLNRSNVLKQFTNLLKQANLPRMRFHDLRHSCASIMISHGEQIIVVSKILGHSKPSVTMNIYAHLLTDQLRGATERMDTLVTPVPVELPDRISVS